MQQVAKSKSPRKIRLDQYLKDSGLAESPEKAQALIMSGQVVVNDQRVDKAGSLVRLTDRVRLKSGCPFVSRGGEKLQSVIEKLHLEHSFENKNILDAGASTGGFTDCVLSFGASSVIAVDTGTNQLAWSLRQDPRVTSLEKTDIRDFNASDWPALNWIVADLSFISLRMVARALTEAGSSGCQYLIMVKPQFEVPKDLIPPGGVIENPAHRKGAVEDCTGIFTGAGLTFHRAVDSGLKGRSGNQETFLYLSKA